MAKVFGAIHVLIQLVEPDEPPTLRALMERAVGSTRGNETDGPEKLERLITRAREALLDKRKRRIETNVEHDAWTYLENLERYASREPGRSDPKQRSTVEQFMEQAFSIFRLSENACYSVCPASRTRSLYGQIIEEGKVLLVSPGPQKLTLSRTLPSLMKLIFQRTVLSRFERYQNQELTNKKRPILFMADEYHTVATQLEGVPFGDSEFFS
jgi:hypothetical protein